MIRRWLLSCVFGCVCAVCLVLAFATRNMTWLGDE